MATLFVSDVHIDADRPETIRRFTDFVAHRALRADALYILGDLFEAWVGDDEDDVRLKPVLDVLARLTDAGVPAAVMQGNRDFLLGRQFCAATGCRLLGDYERIEINGAPVLLTHGDLLCTDDTRYMTLRTTLRDARWQSEFLAKSLGERRAIAADLRQLSAKEIAAKAEEIMDVNQDTVADVMRRHGVATLLHGHTHRPDVHRFELDGQHALRIVLGAWYERPSILAWDATGFDLER
jgi:UDP-2,3-diacylglucosamine hydrolase